MVGRAWPKFDPPFSTRLEVNVQQFNVLQQGTVFLLLHVLLKLTSHATSLGTCMKLRSRHEDTSIQSDPNQGSGVEDHS